MENLPKHSILSETSFGTMLTSSINALLMMVAVFGRIFGSAMIERSVLALRVAANAEVDLSGFCMKRSQNGMPPLML